MNVVHFRRKVSATLVPSVAAACMGVGALWVINWPVIDAEVNGLPWPGGWTWMGLSVFNLFIVLAMCQWGWTIYIQHGTTFYEEGLGRPGIRGEVFIPWSEVEQISRVFYGLKIRSGSKVVYVDFPLYTDLPEVLRFVEQKVTLAQSRGSPP